MTQPITPQFPGTIEEYKKLVEETNNTPELIKKRKWLIDSLSEENLKEAFEKKCIKKMRREDPKKGWIK